MLPRIALILAAALAMQAQQARRPTYPPSPKELPKMSAFLAANCSARKSSSPIIKNRSKTPALSKLADELKVDLEKNDYNVLSLATLKKIDEIDKLAKRIHDRLKRF
jgi:hypothetical protein